MVMRDGAHARGEAPATGGAGTPRPEDDLRTTADQLPLIVWQHGAGTHQGWVNETFCRYFGVTRAEMTGDHWERLIHPDDRGAYVLAFALAVERRTPFHTEVRVLRAGGAWRWLESWAEPRFDADGTYLGHIGTSVDVTERKEAEAALRAAAALDAYRARLADALRTVADPIEIQTRAARLLGTHLGASRVHYAEVDDSGEYGHVVVDYRDGVPSVVGRHRFDDHSPAVMDDFRAGHMVVVDDVASDPRIDDRQRAATASLQVGAYVMVPLYKDGRTVATLVAHHVGAHRWADDELVVIRETADRTWSAVEQAQVEQRLREQHARAELVARLLSDLEQQSTVTGQVQRLAELLVPAMADYATVEVPDRQELVLGLAHRDPEHEETLRSLRLHHRLAPDDPNSVAQVAAGQPRLIVDVTPELVAGFGLDPVAAERFARLNPRSHIAVPLDLGIGVRGALMVGVVDPARPRYTAEDLAFLVETGQRVSVVLTAARLRQEEHDISVRLQQALLPDRLHWHPNVVVEARYQAASALLEVGGDWYDTFSWPDGRIGVMVGDVVGHNLDSAAAMGRLRAATAALAALTESSPAALMDALERFARGRDGTDFATAVCVVVDPASGQLAYTSAGHPPVIVVPPTGPPVRLAEAQTAPLSAGPPVERPEATYLLEPGSLVILYSDGLVERRRERLDVGLVRLERAAARLRDQPIAVVAERLIADLTAGAPPMDDIVVACFHYAPATEQLRLTIPAASQQLAGLRRDVKAWLDEHGVTGRRQSDVLLGMGEACTNAIEHAYPQRPGRRIEVELSHHRHHLTAVIRDRGTWRPAGQHSRFGGRGTTIMRRVSDRFARTTSAEGTTVVMTFPVTGSGAEVAR